MVSDSMAYDSSVSSLDCQLKPDTLNDPTISRHNIPQQTGADGLVS